jgi:GPI mannosyltransferase 4
MVLTPWNALAYNSRASNLAAHGLHPRVTHAAVNMPLLFGALYLIALPALAKAAWCRLRGTVDQDPSTISSKC